MSDRLPGDSHNGGDLEALRSTLKQALVGPVAKSADEILELSVTSDWAYGAYWDTLVRYRKVSGTALWHDSDGDGVCRFVTYHFIADEAGANAWSRPRFKSFCNGCAEGEVRCP